MADSIDRFLEDLSRRYPVDKLFVSNIRPLVDRIFKDTTKGEERERLLSLVEQSFKRQSEARENVDHARDGIRKIFSSLFEQIIRDIGGKAKGSDDADLEGLDELLDDDPLDGSTFEEWDEARGAKPIWGELEASEALPRRGDVLFGEFLVRRGVLDRTALLGALEEQVRGKPLMGWVGLRRGLLNDEQLLTVLTRQAREDRRFGEIAIEEGFLDEETLDELRRVQRKYTPKLGRILVDRGDLSAEALTYFLEEFGVEIGRKD